MPKYRSYRPRIKPQYQVGTYGIRQQARNRKYAFMRNNTWHYAGGAMQFIVPKRHYVRGKPNTLKYYYK